MADAGALVSAVYDAARNSGLQLDAHGGCLIWKRCQTVGGVLATNVHHAGLPTYAERCAWLDLVTPTGQTVRVHAGSQLFRLTVGGSGRTGIIVRAAFRLTPRTYYKVTPLLTTIGIRKTFAAEMSEYAEAHDGTAPLDLVYTRAIQPFGITVRVKAERVAAAAGTDAADASLGEPPWAYRLFVSPLFRLAQELPYELWLLFQIPLMITASLMSTCARRGPVHLDHAASLDYLTWEKHQEVEFFVPVPDAEAFGAWWDRYRRGTRYLRNALIGLRYVYGTDLAFAANAPAGQNYVCFNIDSYHVPTFRGYTRELERAARAMREEFEGRVRTHPGKLNLPSGTYHASDVHVVAQHDPRGVFEVPEYDPAAFAFRVLPPTALWLGIAAGVTAWALS